MTARQLTQTQSERLRALVDEALSIIEAAGMESANVQLLSHRAPGAPARYFTSLTVTTIDVPEDASLATGSGHAWFEWERHGIRHSSPHGGGFADTSSTDRLARYMRADFADRLGAPQSDDSPDPDPAPARGQR